MFWLAAVRDAFSRRIVGRQTSTRCDTDLILAALEYGIYSRDVRDGDLIHHSDKGSNYTSFRFAERLYDNGILPSMGSVGDSYDTALIENFWSTVKIELVYRSQWRTRDEAENALFAYVDGWHKHPAHPERARLPQPGRIRDGLASRSGKPDRARIAHPATGR